MKGTRSTDSTTTSTTRTSFYFYAIMWPSVFQDGKLRIPEKFVDSFGYQLSDTVVLTVPDGRRWNIGLEKEGNSMLLHSGWKEFVEFYPIGYRYLLAFEYGGTSTFHVLIFDLAAVEIQYPLPRAGDGRAPTIETDRCIAVSERKRKQRCSDGAAANYQTRLRNTHKMRGTTGSSRFFGVQEDVIDLAQPVARVSMAENRKKARRSIPTPAEKQRREPDANQCKSKRPSFTHTLPLRNIYAHVYVPQEFTEKYLSSKDELIKLQASDGRQWDTRCCPHSSKSRACGKVISAGWRKCLRDNNMKGGDCCIFELVKTNPVVLKFSILRAG